MSNNVPMVGLLRPGKSCRFLTMILLCFLLAGLAGATTYVTWESQDIVNASYGAATLVSDPGATNGTTAQFNSAGSFMFYPGLLLSGGRYRFTISGKVAATPGPLLSVQALAAVGSTYPFWVYGNEDFSAVTPAQGYVQIICDLVVPVTDATSNAGFRVSNIPAGFDCDWMSIADSPVTLNSFGLVGVTTAKLRNHTTDPITAQVMLLNGSGSAQNETFRLRVESGADASTTITTQTVSVPGNGIPYQVDISIPARADGGDAVIAELLDTSNNVIQTVRDFFYTADSPLVDSAGYGCIGMQLDPYGANNAAEKNYLADLFRESYFPFAEIDFWAPCELSMLVPPLGATQWWSGQNLEQWSDQQLLDMVSAANAVGIDYISYVDYSVVYGYRILDAARANPLLLAYDGLGLGNGCAYDMSDAAAMTSRQRVEDDATHSYTSSDGQCTPVTTSNAAVKLHGDQLEATLSHYGFIGARWDDPLDATGDAWDAYDGIGQTQLCGLQGPLNGWTAEGVLQYFKNRMTAVNPHALMGHNTDPMQAWSTSTRNTQLETAVMRQDSGFCLQEPWSNHAFSSEVSWTSWMDNNLNAGQTSKNAQGQTFVIWDASDAPNDDERDYAVALMGAGGTHPAYQAPPRGMAQFLARYADLLYNDKVFFESNPTGRVAVNSGSTTLWWQPYVRCYYTVPGTRWYIAHLINPPATTNMNASTSCVPAPVNNVQLTWTLPSGWTADGNAWYLTPDQASAACEFMAAPNPAYDGISSNYNVLNEQLTIRPTASTLTVTGGTTVTVPVLNKWGIVVFECTGPTTDNPNGPAPNLPPLPNVPDATQPDAGAPINTTTYQQWGILNENWDANGTLQVISDPNASNGQATQTNGSTLSTNNNQASAMNPAGTYLLTLRARTTSSTVSDCSFWQHNAGGEDIDYYSINGSFSTHTLTPAQGYQIFTTTVTAGETPAGFGFVAFNLSTFNGLVVDYMSITPISILSDAARLPLQNGQTAWPATPPSPQSHSGLNVWYANGLYEEYYQLENAMNGLGSVNLSLGKPDEYFGEAGFNGTAFPADAQTMVNQDLVIIANQPALAAWNCAAGSFGWRDWLRGYVQQGGHVLFLGGPYGFGRGGWGSDLVRGYFPRLAGTFDVFPG